MGARSGVPPLCERCVDPVHRYSPVPFPAHGIYTTREPTPNRLPNEWIMVCHCFKQCESEPVINSPVKAPKHERAGHAVRIERCTVRQECAALPNGRHSARPWRSPAYGVGALKTAHTSNCLTGLKYPLNDASLSSSTGIVRALDRHAYCQPGKKSRCE